jgi:uncharacterized membrane protein YdjX (TVP38/TMEM64 family)
MAMSVWAWIGVGAAALSLLGLLIGLAVAKVLATIAAEASAMIEDEAWAASALTRAMPATPDQATARPRTAASRR